MFERRLKVVLFVFVAGWVIIAARLFQLQVLEADQYRAEAQKRLIKYEKTLEPMRGRILDRNGRVLASDEPKWAIAIHFGMLKPDDDEYYTQLAAELLEDAKLLERHAPNLLRLKGVAVTDQNLIDDLMEVSAQWVASEIEVFWQLLSTLFPEQPRKVLRTRAKKITETIAGWKTEYVAKEAIGDDEAKEPQIREETQCHPIVTGLNRQQRIDGHSRLRRRFAWLFDLGAVEVADVSKREYHQAECLAHVVGHQGEVTEGDIDKKPYYNKLDETIDLGGYRARDRKGESGVERMSEDDLRGTRGSLTVYRDERTMPAGGRPPLRIEPVNGKDVTLTIDYALQSAIYDLLHKAVSGSELVPGGSVVVLDIPTREVLALVSYPSYDPNTYRSDYRELIKDLSGFPLHFRAVYRQYEPGSIVKPLTIVAAHSAGLINAQTKFDCRGRLDPNIIGKFRCWVPVGRSESIHHRSINSEQAIKGSCNVFCFNLGDLFRVQAGGPEAGVALMCDWMNQFGLGKLPGIGLEEERKGIVPDSRYFSLGKQRRLRIGDPRNYAIGQGEMQVTPLQAANLVATYASGLHGLVSLLRHEQSTPPTSLPVEDSVWRIIRRGMYQVVNDPRGTATQSAKLDQHLPYVLCGKSGSAQTTRWITDYLVTYRDGDGERSMEVEASTKSFAYDEFVREMMPEESVPRDQAAGIRTELRESIISAEPVAYWPKEASEDRQHSHAWFVAFLQPKGADGEPDWNAQARIAIAVLLEFGGSGGRTSGPVCRDVAKMIINDFPRYVTGQHPLAVGNR